MTELATIVGNVGDSRRARRRFGVKRSTLARQVADQIAEAIRSGRFPPGTRLVETQLATEMSTSRGPVREALRELTDEGLIEIVPHKGATVIQPSRAELADMVLIRAVLEGVAARLLVARRDSSVFQALERIVKSMSATGDANAARLRELDWRFHETICKGSGSPLVLKTWLQMRDRIELIINASNPIYTRTEFIVEHHAALLEHLTKASPAQAESTFRQSALESGFEWLGQPAPAELSIKGSRLSARRNRPL